MTSGEHTKGHTELPWSLNPHHPRLINGGPNHREVAKTAFGTDEELAENTANANLIVTAVNTYPAVAELVKALEAIERGGVAVLLDAALSDAPEGFDECPINPNVLQKIVDDSRSALTRFREAQAGGGA